MTIDINEGIEESKINISAQLEYIGICAGDLLNSTEARENPLLFRCLSIILRQTFKTYLSTSNLEGYLLKEENEINESEKRYYTNFFEYRRAIVRINSFINVELEKHSNRFADPKDENTYNILKNANACLIQRLEELIKIEVAIKMERAKSEWRSKFLFRFSKPNY